MVDTGNSDEGYQVFATPSEYKRAVNGVISSAKLSLTIFDIDLIDLGFEEQGRNELLRTFLSQNLTRRLRIVLHDVLPLQQRGARMLNLVRDFSRQIEVRQLWEMRDTDAFFYNDKGVCLYRPSQQHLKSILTLHDSGRHRLLSGRFGLMFEKAEPCALSAALGL